MNKPVPTKQQRKLVSVLVKDPSLTLREAAAKSNYSGATSAWATLHKPHVQEYYRAMMEKVPGLRDEALLLKLEAGTSATKKQYFANLGKVEDVREDADFFARKQYIELVLKLKGALSQAPDRNDGDSVNGVSIDFSKYLGADGKKRLTEDIGRELVWFQASGLAGS